MITGIPCCAIEMLTAAKELEERGLGKSIASAKLNTHNVFP